MALALLRFQGAANADSIIRLLLIIWVLMVVYRSYLFGHTFLRCVSLTVICWLATDTILSEQQRSLCGGLSESVQAAIYKCDAWLVFALRVSFLLLLTTHLLPPEFLNNFVLYLLEVRLGECLQLLLAGKYAIGLLAVDVNASF